MSLSTKQSIICLLLSSAEIKTQIRPSRSRYKMEDNLMVFLKEFLVIGSGLAFVIKGKTVVI